MKKIIHNSSSGLVEVMEVVLLGAIFFVPLFYASGGLFVFSSSKSILIILASLILLGLFGFLVIRNKEVLIPAKSPFFILLSLFVVWLFLASLVGTDFHDSLWSTFERSTGLLLILSSFILSLFASALAKTEGFLKKCAIAFVLSGVGVVLSVYYALIHPNSYFALLEVGGGFIGNSSFAGGFLLFAIACGLCLLLSGKSKRAKWIWGIATAFIIFSPIFIDIFHFSIGSARAALLGLFIGVFASVVLWIALSEKKIYKTLGNTLFVLGFLTLSGLSIWFFQPHSLLQEKFIEAATPTRLLYGKIALMGAAERPFLGWGWEHFPRVEEKYFDPISLTPEYLKEGRVDKPHNVLLEILVTSGFPGLILYLAAFGFLLILIISKTKEGALERKTGVVFFGLFIAYFFQNLFVFDTPTTYLAFFVTAGLLAGKARGDAIVKKVPLRLSPPLEKMIQIAVIVLVLGGAYFLAFEPIRESFGIHSLSKTTIEERVARQERAYEISAAGGVYDKTYLAVRIHDNYATNIEILSEEEKTNAVDELRQQLSIMEEIIEGGKAYSETYSIAARLATLIELYGNLTDAVSSKERIELIKKAEKYAREAILLSPTDPKGGYWPLARVLLVSGRVEQAFNVALAAYSLEPSLPASQNVVLNVASFYPDASDHPVVEEILKARGE